MLADRSGTFVSLTRNPGKQRFPFFASTPAPLHKILRAMDFLPQHLESCQGRKFYPVFPLH